MNETQSKSIQKHIRQKYKKATIIIKNDIYSDIVRNYGKETSINKYINQLIKADLKQFDPF